MPIRPFIRAAALIPQCPTVRVQRLFVTTWACREQRVLYEPVRYLRYVGATSDIHHALAAPRWRLARSGAAAIVAVLRRCRLGVNDAYRFETPLGLRGLTSRRTGVTYIL